MTAVDGEKAKWTQFRDGLQAWRREMALSSDDRFSPYSDEGGTAAAISGENFVVIASDTRMSRYNAVLTREGQKIFCIAPSVYLAATGFYGDSLQLVKVLGARVKQYRFTYHEEITVSAAAQLLSRTLYYKRFFPYYVGALLAGIDESGCGAVFGYDPVGTIERVPYASQGAGSPLIEPFFDNQIGWSNQPKETKLELTAERAKQVMCDAFRAVAEREVSTGDSIHLVMIQAREEPEETIVKIRSD